MDELEMSGLVMTRQAYQMRGGNLFQITGKGIDFVQSGGKIYANSASWTGRIDVSEVKKTQIQKHLVEIRQIVDEAKMTNTQKCNVLAVVGAIETLVQAPDPPWAEVLRLIRSPTVQGITGIAALLLAILALIIPVSRLAN